MPACELAFFILKLSSTLVVIVIRTLSCSIEKVHAKIDFLAKSKEVFITPGSHTASTRINGKPLTSKAQLVDLDRVLFGEAPHIIYDFSVFFVCTREFFV